VATRTVALRRLGLRENADAGWEDRDGDGSVGAAPPPPALPEPPDPAPAPGPSCDPCWEEDDDVRERRCALWLASAADATAAAAEVDEDEDDENLGEDPPCHPPCTGGGGRGLPRRSFTGTKEGKAGTEETRPTWQSPVWTGKHVPGAPSYRWGAQAVRDTIALSLSLSFFL